MRTLYMKHKWHKEIKAWADGAEIEYRYVKAPNPAWMDKTNTEVWSMLDDVEYRIKPQPKEPQYLYAYQGRTAVWISTDLYGHPGYLGKIKLEADDV